MNETRPIRANAPIRTFATSESKRPIVPILTVPPIEPPRRGSVDVRRVPTLHSSFSERGETDVSGQSEGGGEPWTVRRVLDWTIEHLRKHGSDSPRLEAEVLLAHARGCDRIHLYTRYEEPLAETERTTMRELVRRRAQHEPVAYLVGHREFFGLDFAVGPGVLVPRPETETLVLEILDHLREYTAPRVLDLCTGSGCIAIAIAKNASGASLVAVELDPTAGEYAARNVAGHELGDRIDLRLGDLDDPLEAGERFDAIVSNPPYVTTEEHATLDPDVRLHEPRTALVGGEDGLDVVRRIVSAGMARLEPNGLIALEIDPAQAGTVRELLEAVGFVDVRAVKDANGDLRVVRGRRPAN